MERCAIRDARPRREGSLQIVQKLGLWPRRLSGTSSQTGASSQAARGAMTDPAVISVKKGTFTSALAPPIASGR